MIKMSQSGFTLVELMLAMTLFSVILIVSTTGFIAINRTYTRGAIKKQLSESIQRINSDTTAVLRNPLSTAVRCKPTDTTGCPPGSIWNALCLSGARYLWPDLVSGNGGLYRDSKVCDAAVTSDKIQLVDSRYMLEDFKIQQLSGSLFETKGVLHTIDLGALTTTDNSEDYAVARQVPGFDQYLTRCKGSSAGLIVQTCAVQSFSFIINSRAVSP